MVEEEINTGIMPEPEHYLPHEIMAGAKPSEPEVNEEPEPDAGMPDIDPDDKYRSINDLGEIDIIVPDDPDELDEFLKTLSPSELKSFQANYGEQNIDPEAAHPEDNEEGNEGLVEDPVGQSDIEHEISQEAYDELPEDVKAYLDQTKSKLDELADYGSEEFKAGMDKFMTDPIVAERYKVLTGEISNPNNTSANSLINDESLKALRIDMDYDRAGSMERLRGFLSNALGQAQQQVHSNYYLENQQKEFTAKLDNELKSISDVDERFKSDLPFNDPKHPMGDFLKWLGENEKNVNIVNIGGIDTYKLWMSKTGQSVPDAAKNARQGMIKNIANAKSKAARTLPKNIQTQGLSDRKIVHGIDVEKFRTDEGYMDSIYSKYGDDPKMLKVLQSWTYQ